MAVQPASARSWTHLTYNCQILWLYVPNLRPCILKKLTNIQLSHRKRSCLVTLLLQRSCSAEVHWFMHLRSAKILSDIKLIISHLGLWWSCYLGHSWERIPDFTDRGETRHWSTFWRNLTNMSSISSSKSYDKTVCTELSTNYFLIKQISI